MVGFLAIWNRIQRLLFNLLYQLHNLMIQHEAQFPIHSTIGRQAVDAMSFV